mgnify:FL=1
MKNFDRSWKTLCTLIKEMKNKITKLKIILIKIVVNTKTDYWNIMKKLDLMQKALVNLILIQIKKINRIKINSLIKIKPSK